MWTENGRDRGAWLGQLTYLEAKVLVVRPATRESTQNTLKCNMGVCVAAIHNHPPLIAVGPKDGDVLARSRLNLLAKRQQHGAYTYAAGRTDCNSTLRSFEKEAGAALCLSSAAPCCCAQTVPSCSS
jgi:hypothetical protein